MKTKIIYGIEYKVIDFKEWQDIKMPNENIYLEAEVVRIGSIECKNLFVEGDQIVKGYQIVEGYQRVKGIVISSYCKWQITVYKKNIKIGRKTKTTAEWNKFFKNKDTYETNTDSIDYEKIESAFKMAKIAQKHLALMNRNADKINI